MRGAKSAGAIDIRVMAFAPEKRPVLEEQQFPLVTDRARYPVEAVAVVVAETLYAARNAAEAVEVEYDVLSAVTDVRGADGAEPIWPSAPDNIPPDPDYGAAGAPPVTPAPRLSRGRAGCFLVSAGGSRNHSAAG